MSEDAMEFLDILHEQIVCFYCRSQYNPLWNAGASEESDLCHVCGSKPAKWETLKDHEQANAEGQSNQVSEPDQSSLLKNAAKSGSSSAPKAASSENYIEKQNTCETVQPRLGVLDKGKSPVVEQLVSLPPERTQEQISNALQDLAISQSKDEEDVLIYQRTNHYIPENEIGLGCMMLPPPAVSPPKDSGPEVPAVSTTNACSSEKSKPKPSTGRIRRRGSSLAGNKVKASRGLRSPVSPSKVSKDSPMPSSHAPLAKDTKSDSGVVRRSSLRVQLRQKSSSQETDASLVDVPVKEASQ